MKKVALSFLLVMGITNAYAQSSVTLYGAIDDELAYTNNAGGSKQLQLTSGPDTQTQSFWGVQGKEELGNGLTTVFKLEGAFDVNGGLYGSGALFTRQAYVGLESDEFGSVLIGRQYDLVAQSTIWLTAALRFEGGLGVDAGDIDNVWNSYNASNAIKYVSPNIKGFTFGGLYRPGGVAGDFSNSRAFQGSVSYANGPLYAAANFFRQNNPGTALYGASASPVAGSTWANPIPSPIYAGYASAGTLQVVSAGASYNIGAFSGAFLYSNTQFKNVIETSSTPFSGDASFNGYEASVTYAMTPSFLVGASYDWETGMSAHYGTLGLGVKYALSKKTVAYLSSSWMHASGTNSLGEPAVAANYFVTPSTTPNQITTVLALRHLF
jgi:predicted porin